MIAREDGLRAIRSLDPAPIFLAAYHNGRLPEDLDVFIRPPEEVFASLTADQQAELTGGRLIPVLGDTTFVALLDPDDRSVVVKHFEDSSLVNEVFETWDRYVADLMIHIGEVLDDDDERLRRIAALLRLFRSMSC